MATSDKNIVITPNTSQTADPKIVFSGADASTSAQNITLQVYPTNNGTLSFEGSNGQLFSISNNMSGTIYSVNDISGIPSIEVLDSGLIKLGQYSGNIVLGSGTDNGNKLQVNGTIRNGSVWINNGNNYNAYNENIRLFAAPNGATVIGFNCSGESGTSSTSLLGYSSYLETRVGEQWEERVYADYLQAYGSYRAPIFYDSNDTGYYCDPNSTSNFYKLVSYQGAKYQTTDWADGFRNTPTSSRCFHGDVSSGGPTGTWWFYDSMRHSNASNYWGTQIAYGWEDNANEIYQRNISGNSFTGWVRYINTNNYTSYTYARNSWNGNIYIGTGGDFYCTIMYDANNSGYYCDPNGTSNLNSVYTQSLYSYGNVTAYSDIKLKSNIKTIDDALNKTLKLRGVYYTKDNEENIGVIAQEVQEIIPEVVKNIGTEYLGVNYGNMVGLLIEAIKEQQTQIETQNSQINKLEQMILELKGEK